MSLKSLFHFDLWLTRGSYNLLKYVHSIFESSRFVYILISLAQYFSRSYFLLIFPLNTTCRLDAVTSIEVCGLSLCKCWYSSLSYHNSPKQAMRKCEERWSSTWSYPLWNLSWQVYRFQFCKQDLNKQILHANRSNNIVIITNKPSAGMIEKHLLGQIKWIPGFSSPFFWNVNEGCVF